MRGSLPVLKIVERIPLLRSTETENRETGANLAAERAQTSCFQRRPSTTVMFESRKGIRLRRDVYLNQIRECYSFHRSLFHPSLEKSPFLLGCQPFFHPKRLLFLRALLLADHSSKPIFLRSSINLCSDRRQSNIGSTLSQFRNI